MPGVTSKDMILHLIGDVGTAAGTGYAVEYAGSAIRAPAGRGAAHALQPHHRDGRAHRHGGARRHDLRIPRTAATTRRRARCGTAPSRIGARLPSDPDAEFDREHTIDMAKVAPQITWGTSPEHVIAVDQAIPDPATGRATSARRGKRRCSTRASSPASRSRAPRSTGCSSAPAPTAASPTCAPPPQIAKGRHKADHVTAWVVPGSERIKREAEAEGPRPACSSTRASNGASPAARCAWRPTASACRRASAASRPPTATSSAARAPARAPISPAPPWPRPPRSRAPSPT